MNSEIKVPVTHYEAVLKLRRVAQLVYDAGIESKDDDFGWVTYLQSSATIERLLDELA
jgi:hypothetical protein